MEFSPLPPRQGLMVQLARSCLEGTAAKPSTRSLQTLETVCVVGTDQGLWGQTGWGSFRTGGLGASASSSVNGKNKRPNLPGLL